MNYSTGFGRTVSSNSYGKSLIGELKSIEGRAEGESGALASNQLTGTRWMDTDQCRAVINFTDIYKSS